MDKPPGRRHLQEDEVLESNAEEGLFLELLASLCGYPLSGCLPGILGSATEDFQKALFHCVIEFHLSGLQQSSEETGPFKKLISFGTQ